MMALRLASLVLACSTGWTLLALGYLPVDHLQRHGRELIKSIVAWMIVAATATPAIFHWYLIIALLCFIAWTKLDRLAGKFWVAAAGALGLSLGIVFPIEVSTDLRLHETAFALGFLYLGGAIAGFAYVTGLRAQALDVFGSRRLIAWVLILSCLWSALLEEAWRNGLFRQPPAAPMPDSALWLPTWLPLLTDVALVALALRLYLGVRKNRPASPWLAIGASFIATATSWLTQITLQ